MKIKWIKCNSYDEARDFSKVIYLHEWNDKPFYWGKAHNSFFGGQMREKDGFRASGRYNAGYKHWIEGCLRHGGKLYIGMLDSDALKHVDEIESFLIEKYGHVMNTRTKPYVRKFNIVHEGDIPTCIRLKGT